MIGLKNLQIKYAAAWRRFCNAKRPRSGRTIKLATTHLLFETIDCLISKGHKRVANSILNSTSNYRWRCRDTFSSHDMIESVDQFPKDLRVENREGMFSLEPSPDGRFYECWIIDRIMEKGCIWAGTLVKDGHNGPDIASQQTSSSHSAKPGNSEAPTSSGLNQQDTRTPKVQGPTEKTADPGLTSTATVPDQVSETERREMVKAKDSKAVKSDSHSKIMLMSSITTEFVDLFLLDDKNPSDFSQSATSAFAMALRAFIDMEHPRPPEKDDLGRRAVFDLDGSTSGSIMVLTPLQMVLESVPRSAARSMSVSWIVEPKPGAPTDGHLVKKAYQVRNMFRGCGDFLCILPGNI